MLYKDDRLDCEWFYYEPNECKKCLLIGYSFCCGSKECKKVRAEYEKSNRTSNQNLDKNNI